MDQLLSKLNLQNLLRQFCCGVVFFVPLFWFVPCQFNGILEDARLEDNRLICVAVLSFIIGTIIYHLEKNLYSYIIQAFFEYCGCYLLYFTAVVFIIGIIGLFLIGYNWAILIGVLLLMLIIACLAAILLPLYSKDFETKLGDSQTGKNNEAPGKAVDNLIKRTELCWEIEDKAVGVSSKQNKIAKRVSVWSDFIHCVQSSCFAWILGTVMAFYLHPCCMCLCNGYSCIYIQPMCNSVVIAIFILLVEIGIDAHRYIHVKRMTASYMQGIFHVEYTGTITKESDGKILTQFHIKDSIEL